MGVNNGFNDYHLVFLISVDSYHGTQLVFRHSTRAAAMSGCRCPRPGPRRPWKCAIHALAN